MAKEYIISGMKTAGVVIATAVVGFGACSQNKDNTVSPQTAMYKADSAAKANPAYKNTLNAIALYESQIQNYKEANKNMLMYYAKNYIRQNIKSEQLQKLLFTGMNEDMLMEVSGLNADDAMRESSGLNLDDIKTLAFFRRNHHWYDALLSYLADKYNERQLLNSGFFNTIKDDKGAKETFFRNAKEIERLQKVIGIVSEREQNILKGYWNQYSQKVR